jgi:hypothetical protein
MVRELSPDSLLTNVELSQAAAQFLGLEINPTRLAYLRQSGTGPRYVIMRNKGRGALRAHYAWGDFLAWTTVKLAPREPKRQSRVAA